MKQLLNLLFISIFLSLNLICSSDHKSNISPKMKVQHRPAKTTYSMPLSENIADSMRNHIPFMGVWPVRIEKILNRTPYVVAVDDVKTFNLLGMINPSSTFQCDYPVDENVQLSLKIYDEEGQHIGESDKYVSIVQHRFADESYCVSSAKTTLSFLVSKNKGDFVTSFLSSWQLEKCRSCNKIPVKTCSDCNELVERSKRYEPVRLALMCMIKPEDEAARGVTLGYKVK